MRKNKQQVPLLVLSLILISQLTLAQTFKKPVAITPRDGWTITREALSFRFAPNESDTEFQQHIDNMTFGTNSRFGNWKPKKFSAQKVTSYQIQVSKKPDGTERVLNEFVYVWAMQHGTAQHIPDAVLPAGTYYWRIRCNVNGNVSPWTSSRKVILANKSPNANMRYAVSNTNPLFVICDAEPSRIFENDQEFFNKLHIEGFSREDFSASKRKHVAVVVNDRTKGRNRFKTNNYQIDDYQEQYDELKSWGYQTMVFHQYSLAEQDWFYRKYDNCIGTFTGETEDLVDFQRTRDGRDRKTNLFYHRSLELADKHGGYFMNATHFTDKTLIARHDEPLFTNDVEHNYLVQHGEHLIWGRKTTNIYANHINNAYWSGLWLDGLLGNKCLWMENYFTRKGNNVNPKLFPLLNNSIPDTHMPAALAAKEMLYAASSGTTVFVSRDNDNSTDPSRSYSARRDHIYQLFEKLIDEKLIPSREEMRAKHPTAIKFEQDDQHVKRNVNDFKTIYQDYEALFRHTYGINQFSFEKTATDLIPDDGGRYHMVPIVTRKPMSNGWKTTRVDIDNLKVTGRFNSARYPAVHTGTAWVARTGNNFFAINSIEARTGLPDQLYNINLGNGFVNRIKGKLNISTYVMGSLKNGGNSIRIMANSHRFNQHLMRNGQLTVNWPKENTVIQVNCKAKPNLSVSPPNALLSQNWNNTTKTMSVTIKHNGGWDIVTVDLKNPGTSSRLSNEEITNATSATQHDRGSGEVTLFPNPANDHVKILGETGAWTIRGVDGRIYLTGTEKSINLSLLKKGVYFMQTTHNVIKKLVVQ
ncbi:MAG: T9SS type A sorting domain-containing protein [Bacteroidota bacterium]